MRGHSTKNVWRKIAGNGASAWQRLLILTLFYLLSMCALYAHLLLRPQQFKEGQVVPSTVFAPITFDYTDSEMLNELTGNAPEGDIRWLIDPTVKDEALANYDSFTTELSKLRQTIADTKRPGKADESVAAAASSLLVSGLAEKYHVPPELVDILRSYQDERLQSVLSEGRSWLELSMRQEINEAKIAALKQGGLAELSLNPQNTYIYFLKPNLRERAAPPPSEQSIDMATISVEKGSVIIAEGQPVTRRAAEQLTALNVHMREQQWMRFCGLGLVLLAALLIWYLYLIRFTPNLLERSGPLSQLCLLFLTFLLIGLLIGRIGVNYLYFGVSFAVIALTAIVVLVYDAVLGLYLGLLLGVLASTALGYGANLLLFTIAGALLPPVFIAPGCRRQRQVLFALIAGLFNLLLAGTVILASVQTLHWEILVIAFVAGFASAVIALGLLPLVETLTAQLTPNKLIELANAENELLKRLKREAHGTYAHSQMVADLTEEALKDIGGDWLTARVGALYHDIGKLKRPGFFAENIVDLSKNPHQGLPPETSVKILKDHVTDGLAMAKEQRLPVELHHFITEHHGSYIIKYFYFKAKRLYEQSPEEHTAPDKRDYCYDGPIPHSRESGVVMLADVTEAVTRAKPGADTLEIENIIDMIISDKIEENQLIASGLTVGDLKKTKDAFLRLLTAQRHHRVQYPEERAPIHFHFLGERIPGSDNPSANPVA
jgi:cyclic-di-AMP phosphodiesterase PgpH